MTDLSPTKKWTTEEDELFAMLVKYVCANLGTKIASTSGVNSQKSCT